jgi:hypothetical protein
MEIMVAEAVLVVRPLPGISLVAEVVERAATHTQLFQLHRDKLLGLLLVAPVALERLEMVFTVVPVVMAIPAPFRMCILVLHLTHQPLLVLGVNLLIARLVRVVLLVAQL